MGALDDAIAAAQSDPNLSPTQRRAAIAKVLVNGINNALSGRLPYTWTGGVWSVTITDMAARQTRFGWALAVWVNVTRNGVPVSVALPIVIVNPPVFVPDPAGTVTRTGTVTLKGQTLVVTNTYREDPVAGLVTALRDTLTTPGVVQ